MILRMFAGFIGLLMILIGILMLLLKDGWLEAMANIVQIITGIIFGMYALRGNAYGSYWRDLARFILRIKNRRKENCE